jgi:hypothetical protein
LELQKIPQGPFSEDDIKHIALSCLKSYYKYYPRKGNTEVKLNQRAEGDIIADGYLSFVQEDGSTFTATFEATSLKKRAEVLFRIQKELLFWDSLTVSCFICLLLTIWEHLFVNNYWIPHYGLGVSILVIILLIALIGGLVAFLLRKRRRYRYIYAIEQFKRYFAHDQWIAISDRIFPDKGDKHYEELRQQCVYNGFGLIIVNDKGEAHVKVAPARTDTFKDKRETLQFFSSEELSRRINLRISERKGWQKYLPLPKSVVKFDASKLKVSRFKRFYGNQIFISLISLVLLSAVLFREYEKEKTIEIRDPQTYREEMMNLRLYPYPFYGPDTIDILDTPYVRSIPFNPGVEPYPLDNSSFDQAGLIILSREGLFIEYACERISDTYTSRFAIDGGRYRSLDRARQVIRRLNRRGVSASILWMGCFNEKNEYMVFIGQFFPNRSGAESELPVVSRRVRQLGYAPALSVVELNY